MSLARRILWALTILYWVAIFVGTHLPPSRVPRTGVGDKSMHFFSYLVLGFLIGTTLWLAFPRSHRLLPLWVVLVAAGYGAFDEVTQALVGRTPDLDDWLADCAGAAVGATLIWVVQTLSPRRGMVGMTNDETRMTNE